MFLLNRVFTLRLIEGKGRNHKLIFTSGIPEKLRTITVEDVLASFGYLLNVIDGYGEKDDIDHLGNQTCTLRWRTAAESVPYRLSHEWNVW
jgi:DNA-directed RNA polymerase beta subunit